MLKPDYDNKMEQPTEFLTIAEYAQRVNKSPRWCQSILHQGRALPGVKRVLGKGRARVVEVRGGFRT